MQNENPYVIRIVDGLPNHNMV